MTSQKWRTVQVESLLQGFTTLKNSDEFALFLRDLLTEPELQEVAGRFIVAIALSEGKSQRVVAKETGISIATVTRVNQWLKRGAGGYQLAIQRIQKASKVSHRSEK